MKQILEEKEPMPCGIKILILVMSQMLLFCLILVFIGNMPPTQPVQVTPYNQPAKGQK